MQGGDISNEISPRLVIAFEGMLGIPPQHTASARRLIHRMLGHRKQLAKMAVDAYEINEPLARLIWDTVWRYHYSVDVVTYLGEDFAEALTQRLDDENLPIGRVWADEPKKLARRLAYMPDVAAVFDNANHLLYGSKGRTLPDVPTTLVGVL